MNYLLDSEMCGYLIHVLFPLLKTHGGKKKRKGIPSAKSKHYSELLILSFFEINLQLRIFIANSECGPITLAARV